MLAYAFRKLDISLVPITLGLVLGQPMEINLRRALTLSNGDWGVLDGSPLAIGLWIVAALSLILPLLLRKFGSGPTAASQSSDSGA